MSESEPSVVSGRLPLPQPSSRSQYRNGRGPGRHGAARVSRTVRRRLSAGHWEKTYLAVRVAVDGHRRPLVFWTVWLVKLTVTGNALPL